MMRLEHAELGKKKEELKEISENFNEDNFAALKEKLNQVAGFLVSFLREHISKENNILYPMALEQIPEETV